MLRNILRIIILFTAFIIQTTFHETLAIGQIAPNLLLILVCCMGFISGRRVGIYTGFFCGLLLDIFFGYENIMGLSAFCFMYLGYINGSYHEIFFTDDICIPLILTTLSDLAYNFLFYCATFLLRGKLDFILYFKKIIFPEMIYTAVITVLLFRGLQVIHEKLEKYERRGGESRVKGISRDYT